MKTERFKQGKGSVIAKISIMCLLMIFAVAGMAQAQKLSDSDYKTVAENFLEYINSNKTIISTEILKEEDDPIGYIMVLDKGGYILIPAVQILPPVKAYSLNSNFDTLPDWYKQFLTDELKVFCKTERNRSYKEDKNISKWDFLLSYKKGKSLRYKPDTFLLTTKWNQSYPYNKKFPKIGDETVVTGCTQIAEAQIMKYHKHPQYASGVAEHTWNSQEFKAILYKNYNWDNMPDVADGLTPEYMQDEISLLLRDLSIANKAYYGLGGTSTSMSTEALMDNFGYATGIKRMTNGNETEFFTTLKNEIDNERPVLLHLPNHATVADGYASDPTGKKIHVNMGWGGHNDDYYYLNETIITDQYTFSPNLSITYNIKPCSPEEKNCYSNLTGLEITDSMSNFDISGKFNSADDIDTYEAYLKGFTTISGNRGYSNQAFYITVYNSKHELVVSSDIPIEKTLTADKYFIEISLKYYTYDSKYTDYTADISSNTLTSSDYAEIESRDTPPVINNDFKDIRINATYKIRLDIGDEDGDELSVNVISSDSSIEAGVDKSILILTPNTTKGYSEITVTASSKGEEVKKTFNVFVSDIFFGKEFTITGTFDSQNDFDKHKVILDGTCTIEGEGGFYQSVLDLNENYVVNMNNSEISYNFQQDVYLIGASLKQNPGGYGSYYPYDTNGNNSYTLFVNCPNADTSIAAIKDLLDMEEDTYIISGYIRDSSGNGVSGVTLNFTGGISYVTTNISGYYTQTAASGWSGSVTPFKSGYSFNPESKSYANVTSNQTEQNYTGNLPNIVSSYDNNKNNIWDKSESVQAVTDYLVYQKIEKKVAVGIVTGYLLGWSVNDTNLWINNN